MKMIIIKEKMNINCLGSGALCQGITLLFILWVWFPGILGMGTASASAPFYGYHFDSEHPEMNDLGHPAWAILSVYGVPSQGNPGPSPVTGEEFYQFCMDHSLIPIFRLEEAWWLAHGMYREHFPNDGILEVAVGDSVQMVGAPGQHYNWTSSDAAIGTVDAQGLFHAGSPGVCQVTAEDDNGIEGRSAVLRISPIVTRIRETILEGSISTFYSSGPSQPHTWSVDDTEIATVDPVTGEFKATQSGTVNLLVTDTEGNTKTQNITIVDAWIRSSRPGFDQHMTPGESLNLTIDGQYSGQIDWQYNEEVLRLDDDSGIFTAIAPGTSSIMFQTTSGDFSNTLDVNVSGIVITAPWKLETIPGDSIQFTARREGASGFIWNVDDPSIGMIDQTGRFTALAPGVCRVIATYGLISVQSDPIIISDILVISEYWTFFEKWVENWVQCFPEAWFQYGNEVGSAIDPYETSYSNIKEGYVIATRHFYEIIRKYHADPRLIAQGACSIPIFEQMIAYGLDHYVDAYALHTYVMTRDMNACSIPSGDSALFMDPDIWHEKLLGCPGVSWDKPWFVTETSTQFNSENVKSIEALPTWFAYIHQFRSISNKKFTAALWFTLSELAYPSPGTPDQPMEGYNTLVDFLNRVYTSPPQNIIMADLEHYANLDGFASAANPLDGNLDGRGNSFDSDLIPVSTIPETLVDRIPFRVPDVTSGKNNIVECKGQYMELPDFQGLKIHIIACYAPDDTQMTGDQQAGESSSVTREFNILYADLSSDHLPISLSHWTRGPSCGEYPAMIMRRYMTPDGPAEDRDNDNNLVRDYNAFLWDYILDLDPEKIVKGVFLPDEPDIKIVAMTMEGQTVTKPQISVQANQQIYYPGDSFLLSADASGMGSVNEAIAYILLDVHGLYWCWPGWNQAPYDDCGMQISSDGTETWHQDILTFTWPESAGNMDTIRIWAALTDMQASYLDFSWCEFGYRE
jgi:hypothetical protein